RRVAQRYSPGGIRPDLVPGDDVRVGVDLDAIIARAGDHVALVGGRSAVGVDSDPVGVGPCRDENAVAGDSQGDGAGDVGSDEVAGDDVPGRPVVGDVDAVVRAPGDDVSFPGVVAAQAVGTDPIVGGAFRDHDPASNDGVDGRVVDRAGAVVDR